MKTGSGLRSRQKELAKWQAEEKKLLCRLDGVRKHTALLEKQIEEFASLEGAAGENLNGKESAITLAEEISQMLVEQFSSQEVLAESALKEKVREGLVATGRSVQGWARAWKSALGEKCEVAQGGLRLKSNHLLNK